jgi:hypothetical protein
VISPWILSFEAKSQSAKVKITVPPAAKAPVPLVAVQGVIAVLGLLKVIDAELMVIPSPPLFLTST